jgi:putative hydrolase of the HAD superfamily
MPVEAIFFDLDDTLVDDAASFRIATARVCAELDGGLDQVLLTATYVQVSDDYWTSRAYAYGDLYEVRLQLWRTALSACGCDDDSSASRARDLYTTYRMEVCEVYDETHSVLEALAGSHRLGVITNGHGETQRNRLRISGLDRYFDLILASTDIDAGKPDTAIFRHALKTVALAPDKALHVGDSLEADVAGALNAGLTAVWLNRRGASREPHDPEPHHEIESLSELMGLLP